MEKSKPIDLILFIVVATSARNNLKQWDIFLENKVFQYDMDARTLLDWFKITALQQSILEPSIEWLKKAKDDGKLYMFGILKQ